MCDFKKYAQEYVKASEILRREGINPEVPGYEFLKRAIVVYIIEKPEIKEKLLLEVKKGMVIPANKDLDMQDKIERKGIEERQQVEQWMIEAAKSVGVDIPLIHYIKKLADEIEK